MFILSLLLVALFLSYLFITKFTDIFYCITIQICFIDQNDPIFSGIDIRLRLKVVGNGVLLRFLFLLIPLGLLQNDLVSMHAGIEKLRPFSNRQSLHFLVMGL